MATGMKTNMPVNQAWQDRVMMWIAIGLFAAIVALIFLLASFGGGQIDPWDYPMM